MPKEFFHGIESITLLELAAKTADSYTPTQDFGGFIEGIVLIRVTAVTGTDPSMDIRVYTSSDGINFFDTADTVNFTAVGKKLIKITNFGKHVRIYYFITGTDTPTFTLEVIFMGKD